MKFTSRAGDLHKALATAATVIPKNPNLVVFSGVHLSVRKGTLEVTGSAELEASVTVTVPAADTADGSAVLRPEPLEKFFATLAADTTVTVESEGSTQLSVRTDDLAPYTFRAMDATFPNVALGKGELARADLTRLGVALAGVAACAADGKLVQIVSDEHGLRLHATDGTRLARAEMPEGGFGSFSGLVPLNVLRRIADVPIHTVEVDRRGRVLTAVGDNVRIVTRLVDQPFPSVDALLDTLPPFSIEIGTAQLRRKLARLESVAHNKRPVVLSIVGDQLELRLESVDVGTGAEVLELAKPAPGEVRVGLNLEFLSAALSAHSSKTVGLHWSSPADAVYLTGTEPLPVTVLIMPVRLPD